MEQEENTQTPTTTTAEQQNESEKAVKNEPVEESDETDFLDDILRNADDIAAACSKVNSVKAEPSGSEVEDIDPGFFDEILKRAEGERRKAEEIRNQRRIKRERHDLEDGEVDDESDVEKNVGNENDRESGKSKKSKKQKRKKSKESPKKPKIEVDDTPSSNCNASVAENNRPRLQIRAEFRSFRAPTPPPPTEDSTASPEESQGPIETHIGSNTLFQPIPFQLNVRQEEFNEQKPEKVLTPEEKLCKVLERIMYAKRAFQKAKLEKEKKFYPNDPVFTYTPTVRKLPTSFSHFTQQIYDNRSPLHTVNNVTFQFNSMATRLNLQEWGLESLPSKACVIARTLGYDVDTMFAKKQSIKIPDKLQKSSQNTSTEEKELCEASSSTLFMNVMVQTEEVKVIPKQRRGFYRDVGLQFTPSTHVMGTQTNPMYTKEGAELPLFKVIRQMNENQLQAIDDFIQFIMEPAGVSGLDLYQQRKRLADIYKTSQIPAEAPIPFKRTASYAGLSERMPSPPSPPSIRTHHDFIKREPNTYEPQEHPERRRSRPPFHRNNHHSQPNSRYNEHPDDDVPMPSVKYYGRGGMRR